MTKQSKFLVCVLGYLVVINGFLFVVLSVLVCVIGVLVVVLGVLVGILSILVNVFYVGMPYLLHFVTFVTSGVVYLTISTKTTMQICVYILRPLWEKERRLEKAHHRRWWRW